MMSMQSNPNIEKMNPDIRTATRFKPNRNWCWRGNNTKYKEKT